MVIVKTELVNTRTGRPLRTWSRACGMRVARRGWMAASSQN